MSQIVFIIGAPRSGTTLLGNILDLHPYLGCWFEPYFVLDRYFREWPNDSRKAEDVSHEVKKYISSAFDNYGRWRRCRIIIDKSPRNALRIPFLEEIFPDAKFIHMLRDGRDTTLSIYKEWRKREEMAGSVNSLFRSWKTLNSYLKLQQFFLHKIALLKFELGNFLNTLKPQSLQHRVRWGNRIGWGPRFEGWEEKIEMVSTLEFNAMQWAKTVEGVKTKSPHLKKGHFLEIRYEDLLNHPKEKLQYILDFLDVSLPDEFLSHIPVLQRTNIGKRKQ
jgi:hypothetical protein